MTTILLKIAACFGALALLLGTQARADGMVPDAPRTNADRRASRDPAQMQQRMAERHAQRPEVAQFTAWMRGQAGTAAA